MGCAECGASGCGLDKIEALEKRVEELVQKSYSLEKRFISEHDYNLLAKAHWEKVHELNQLKRTDALDKARTEIAVEALKDLGDRLLDRTPGDSSRVIGALMRANLCALIDKALDDIRKIQ